MLNHEEIAEIAKALRHSETRQAAIPDALRIVQDRRRWVDDQAVQDIAHALEVSADTVEDIATFYSLIYRRPVGRHVILLCDSVSCYVTGYETLRDYLCKRLGIALGQTTADDRFTLLSAACLGVCEQAPAMMIDGEVYGELTAERIEQALEKHQ